eukprot:3174639-Pyramimonas_sp.AAC.1
MRRPPPSTAFRGPIGNATTSPSRTARMRHPPPSAALRGPIEGAPPKAPVGPPACIIHHQLQHFVAPERAPPKAP